MSSRSRCGSCGAPVWWATSADPPGLGGRRGRIPLDHATVGDPAGNLDTWRDAGGVLRYRPLRKGEELPEGHRRAVAHFATCPQAAQWRGATR